MYIIYIYDVYIIYYVTYISYIYNYSIYTKNALGHPPQRAQALII